MAFSCNTPPKSHEVFIMKKDALIGVYDFNLDLSDSLSKYDIKLFSSLDRADDRKEDSKQIKLSISLFSPSNEIFSEVVYIPRDKLIRESRSSKFYFLPYRADIIPPEYGDWSMRIRMENDEGVRGLGVQLIKKNLPKIE